MNGEVKALFRAKKAFFKSFDKEAYKTTWASLTAGIMQAKQRQEQRLERDFNTNDTTDMWQAIQTTEATKASCVRPCCLMS